LALLSLKTCLGGRIFPPALQIRNRACDPASVGGFAASLQAFGRVFANPRVRNVQIAGAGSTLGIWAYGVALPVYAYHSGGARAVGLLFFARFVLAALASPWIGLLADRWSRRRVMLTSDLLRAAIMLALTVVASSDGNP